MNFLQQYMLPKMPPTSQDIPFPDHFFRAEKNRSEERKNRTPNLMTPYGTRFVPICVL